MSYRHNWTRCEQLPVPLEFYAGSEDDYFASRRVLIYYRSGECAVGWVELYGPWDARADGDRTDYIGRDGATVQWSSEDGVVNGDDPLFWRDLPPGPALFGFAIMGESLHGSDKEHGA